MLDMADLESVEQQGLEVKSKSVQKDAGLKEKITSALNDGPSKALDLLRSSIDEVVEFFELSKVDPVAKPALKSLLATISLTKLRKLSIQSDRNSEMQGLAPLKSAIMEVDARMSVLGGGDVKEENWFLAETGAKDPTSFGVFTKNGVHDVLMEWKLVVT